MVKSRKGSTNVWDVDLSGLKERAVVRSEGIRWKVCPLSLTDAQRRKAVDLVKKRFLGN